MIYICQAPGQCCKALDKACTECSKALGPICKPVSQCIEFVCTPITKVLDRPFGFFVIFAALINIPAAVVAALGVVDPEVADCEKHPLVIFCIVDIVLAVMHIAMALYIQYRLSFGLQEGVLNAKTPMPGAQQTFQQAVNPGQEQELSTRDLMQRAGEIIMYDVGFCLYVFAFIGAFVFNGLGMDWIRACNPDSAYPRAAGVLHLFFLVGALFIAGVWLSFLFCQACCDCLDGSSKRRKQQHQQQQQRQQPPKQQYMQSGLTTLVLGRKKGGQILRPPPQQQQGVVLGPQAAPIQGVPAAGFAPAAAPPASVVYGQPQAMPAPSAPPMTPSAPPMAAPVQEQSQQPQQKGGMLSTVGGFAATGAAAGIGAAGRGLQAVGKRLAKDKTAGE